MTTKPLAPAKPATPLDGEPKPWAKAVSGAELLDDLVITFRRFLALPEGAAETLALWVIFTHAIDASAVAPRLAILSPTPRCGKTTLLGLLIRLVRRPLPTSNVSPALVYRIIARHQPTVLIDEADTFFGGRSDLRGIVNCGHSRDTAFVDRWDVDANAPARFGTYTAIAIAKIGTLPAALLDRCLVIRMRRKRVDENMERFREDRAARELIKLKRKAIRWAIDNLAVLKSADPNVPKNLNDRAADNWRILLAIGDLASGHWPATARGVAVLISGDEEDTSLPVLLLHDIQDIFETRCVDRLSGADVVGALADLEDRPWSVLIDGAPINAHRLSRMLAPFGISPVPMRIPSAGGKNLRGYERAQFEDAWARYPHPQTATPQQPSQINGLGEAEPATQTATGAGESATNGAAVADRGRGVADHVAPFGSENYNKNNAVAAVAVSEGGAPERPGVDASALMTTEYPAKEFPDIRRRGRRRRPGSRPRGRGP